MDQAADVEEWRSAARTFHTVDNNDCDGIASAEDGGADASSAILHAARNESSGGTSASTIKMDRKSVERLLVRVSSIENENDHAGEQAQEEEEQDEEKADHGIVPGTLELISVTRRQWIHAHEPPLAIAATAENSNTSSPILQELTRCWRVLKLKPAHPATDGLIKRKELSAEQTLLKNYEPRFSPGEPTFPSDVQVPGYLQPRTAVEEATAFLVTPRLKFTLGMIEPLYCRLVVYDVSLGCRVTEEFAFTLPPASSAQQHRKPSSSPPTLLPSPSLRALFYTLPTYATSSLYLVLKISKGLMGDGDLATAPYCNPEKFVSSEAEQQRLLDRTTDSTRRLGKYQQSLAWGAISLSNTGANRPMALYRQRGTINDDQRMPLIVDASRGTLKEKQMPCVCELDVEKIDPTRLEESKFAHKSFKTLGKKDATLKLPFLPILDIRDPFTASVMKNTTAGGAHNESHQASAAPLTEDGDGGAAGAAATGVAAAMTFYDCREVQPFSHASAIATHGLYGSGPIATSYVNALYLYPLHVDRFPFRNVAVRVQLLHHEVEFVCGQDDVENQNAFVKNAFYGPDNEMCGALFTHVNYHTKNPQFEKELKVALPDQLTLSHHLLFTFYHVHCKKLPPTQQQQQELVGCAWLPLLSRDGALVEDSEYVLQMLPASAASKSSTSGGIISLPLGYLDAARNSFASQAIDLSSSSKMTTFSCRTKALSSVRSQDSHLAAFLEPFQSKPLQKIDLTSQEQVISRLHGLRKAPADRIRHFVAPVITFLIAYLRFGVSLVRRAAFRALLGVLDKVTWLPAATASSSSSSSLAFVHDANQILLHFVSLAFDDQVVEGCGSRIFPKRGEDGPPQRYPLSTVQAMIVEWLAVLQDKAHAPSASLASTSDDAATASSAAAAATKISLCYSNILLQLVLKAIATSANQNQQKERVTRVPATDQLVFLLPRRVHRADDLLMEDLLVALVKHSTLSSNGLLVQKEVNLSVASFCCGLFLVAKSFVPVRSITHFLTWTLRCPGDANVVTVHLLFPFLNALIEFEFFVVVNGFHHAPATATRTIRTSTHTTKRSRGAWLARLIFERLLRVVDEQVEDRIRSDALRLLRRMFVAQVYNPRHQTQDHQELIALMYFPMIPSIAKFTTDGKLLATSAPASLAASDATLQLPPQDDSSSCTAMQPSGVFRKELLICVAHLLSSVTLPYVSWYFRQSVALAAVASDTVGCYDSNSTTGTMASTVAASVSLSPTASLMHYRKLVEETKLRSADGRRASLIQRNLDKVFATPSPLHPQQQGQQQQQQRGGRGVYDEVRVHACLSLVRQIIEVFLVCDDTSATSSSSFSSFHVLSPDLVARDGRVSLFELETHLKQRRSRHRGSSLSRDAVAAHRASSTSITAAATAASTAAAGSKTPNAKYGPSSGGSFSGLSSSTGPSGPMPRLSTQKSLPRTWGKNYNNSQQQQQQQRVSLSGSGDKGSSSLVASTFPTTSGSTSTSSGRKSYDDSTSAGDIDPTAAASDEYESNTQNLHRIIADTALKALRTAVDQFEWVLRIIEVPFDYQHHHSKNAHKLVSSEQAISLLGSLVDIFFLLMKRASAIACLCTTSDAEVENDDQETVEDDAGCFLAELFRQLHTFLFRFQKALFATRISGLPLIHDQSRVLLLVSLSATATLSSVRQLAASFLYQLVKVCYEQTGSFLLIKRPLLKVFCHNFFSTSALQIPTFALREAIELWRQQSFREEQEQQDEEEAAVPENRCSTFELLFGELLDGLTSQIKLFEIWHDAMTQTQTQSDGDDGERSLDYEELEDGLYRIVQSVSSLWLVEVKTQWMDALVQLHAARSQYAEAACCTLENMAFKEEAAGAGTELMPNQPFPWLVTELRNARELAHKAQWHTKVLELSEKLLTTLRQLHRFSEYQETLRVLDGAIQQLAETTQQQQRSSSSGRTNDPFSAFCFYRVLFAGDCVPSSLSKHEFIYKRSKFVSLGEFVGEMKAILRAKFPICERVDILPEAKPLPSCLERHATVVFLRVTNVEPTGLSTEFKFSTPFTLTGSLAGGGGSYGKTCDQMKRVTFLETLHGFPCTTRRQIVTQRREVVRCPIDNSMDDIRKRCLLLQDEIDKETLGLTDLKTLTLVLKGSVDTHVHGGVPEVIDAFLTTSSAPLVDIHGKMMGDQHSVDKREELADLVVEFLEACWTCLMISRLAFKRIAMPTTATTATTASGSFFSGETVHTNTNANTNAMAAAAGTTTMATPTNPLNPSPNKPALSSSNNPSLLPTATTTTTTTSCTTGSSSSIARVLATLGLPLVEDDTATATLSPLQVEFEKGFAILMDQMRTKVAFPYPRDNDLMALYHHTESHRRPRAASLKAAPQAVSNGLPAAAVPLPLPPPPPPQQAVTTSSLLLPPPPPATPSQSQVACSPP